MKHIKKILQTILLLLICSSLCSQLYKVNMEKDSKWAQDVSGVTKIKVYWENPTPENTLQRQWVTTNNTLKWTPPSNINFIRLGQKPIHLMLLSNAPDEKFYIYADGTIMVYNMIKKTYFECGKKQAPYYRNTYSQTWAWTFYRYLDNNMRETYTISTIGEAWSISTKGAFSKYGAVKYVDF